MRSEIGLAVSVGVARTKHLAKIASQVAKPDGLVVVDPGAEREFLDPLPVELVWGVGPSTQRRLASVGIRSIGDLAGAGGDGLEGLLGRATGAKLALLAANRDPRRIETGRSASSVGAQAALGSQLATSRLIRSTVGFLADRVAGRLRASGRAGRTVTARVRFGGLRSVTRSVTPPAAVSATLTLTEIAVELVSGALADHPLERHLTLLGVSVANLVREPDIQLELPLGPLGPVGRSGLSGVSGPPDPACRAGRQAADRAVDAIRARFGRSSVGYADLGWSEHTRVPEAFRELAERPVGPGRGITP